MNLFDQIIRDFSTLPYMEWWDDIQTIFRNAASAKPNHWLLPLRACEAVGGSQEQAVSAMLAIACAHVGILLVDDMLDDDSRGAYHRLGMPAVSNMAGAFQAAALQTITQSAQEPFNKLIIITSFNEMFLSTAFGQFLDVQAPADEDAYWRTTRAKSSPFFGTALQMGALAGGATLEVAEKLKELGCLYGEMIQIHDDMHDAMEIPANPDWVQGRSPLPILFASLVEHPEQRRFLELNRQIAEPGALQEAQEILIRCGAISYCVDQLIQRYHSARETLSSTSLKHKEGLDALIENVISPVRQLFEGIGVGFPASPNLRELANLE